MRRRRAGTRTPPPIAPLRVALWQRSVVGAGGTVEREAGRRRGLTAVGAVEADADVTGGGDRGVPRGVDDGDVLAGLAERAVPPGLHRLSGGQGEGQLPAIDGAGAVVGDRDAGAEPAGPGAGHC